MKKLVLPKKIAKSARLFISIFLPLILIESAYILFQIATSSPSEIIRDFSSFVYMIEHILMSLLLCVGSFAVLDIGEKEREQ